MLICVNEYGMKVNLLVSWKSDVDNSSVLTESLTNNVLIGIEGKVTEEEGVGRWVLGITELSSAVVSTLSWCGGITGSGEVNVGLTTINESTLLGSKSGSSIT